MTFGQAISSCYSQYATFSGRASRSEFWFFQLFSVLAAIAMAILDSMVGMNFAIFYGPLYVIFALANFLPALSVLVRRLHDTDRSGWWYWIILVPIVGIILLLVWWCTRGSWGQNRFGSDPLGGEGFAHTFPSSGPSSGPPPGDLAEQLSRLAKLRDEGTISEEEFQRLKTKLI
jgi:uncharacterized membrane protein YhaH (DUF805 family)